MAKQSGLGDNLFIDEFEIGGDIGSIQRVACPLAVQEAPGIKMYGQDRIGLKHDGAIDYSAWFNPDDTAGAEGAHEILKGRPTTDRYVTYCRGTLAGSPAASLISKQMNYDGSRGEDGSFTFGVNSTASAGIGLEWGVLLAAAPRTDSAATSPATGIDLGASPTSYSHGWSAYLHVLAFTGTSVTVTLQDSADNSSFTSLTGGAFTAATGRGKQRLASASATATVRRYVRAITTGTFSNAVFVVNFIRNQQAAS